MHLRSWKTALTASIELYIPRVLGRFLHQLCVTIFKAVRNSLHSYVTEGKTGTLKTIARRLHRGTVVSGDKLSETVTCSSLVSSKPPSGLWTIIIIIIINQPPDGCSVWNSKTASKNISCLHLWGPRSIAHDGGRGGCSLCVSCVCQQLWNQLTNHSTREQSQQLSCDFLSFNVKENK